MAAVLACLATAPMGAPAGAREDVGDADLEQASAGRTIVLGPAAGTAPPVRMPLELYVARVVAGEGEPDAAPAALQALAVAVRTYAIAKAGTHRRDGFDLCDSTHCQVPRPATASSRQAALQTAGQILTYLGSPAEIFYSASCGGRSESASQIWSNTDFPYLRSVRDDVHDEDRPWTLELSLDEAQRILARAGFGGHLTDLRVDGRTVSGRVARVKLAGMRPDVIAGDRFRMMLGASRLRSTAFSISRRGRAVRFTGRGYGHGVGLCVVGAGRRARRGEDARSILATYYPGLAIDVLAGAAPPRRDPPAGGSVELSSARRRGTGGIRVEAADDPSADLGPVEQAASRAYADVSARLGASATPIAIVVHPSLESFRAATGRPWWISAAVTGTSVELAPLPLVAQRDGLDATLRAALVEVLTGPALADRPQWVRVGAARYLSKAAAGTGAAARPPAQRTACPSDAELLFAVSAAAQRDADARAEACFARAYERTGDWRSVR